VGRAAGVRGGDGEDCGMSNGDRWMPLYVSDYLGDTMHLTTLQHGAYVLLLMHYWKTGPLPDDHEALAAITKLDAAAWKGVWAKLGAFFIPNGDGTLHQKRMDKERQHWTDLSEKRRDAGKRGAEAKHRPHPSNGGAPPTSQPKREQPQVEPRPIAPQPSLGKTMAIATPIASTSTKPYVVDNLAIAKILPEDLPQPLPAVSGNCQDFATRFASVPCTKKENILLSSQEECAREAKPGVEKQNSAPEAVGLPPDGLKALLDTLPPLPGPSRLPQRPHNLDVQKAAVTKAPRPKACHIAGLHLAAMRKQAGIGVGA
jgi:uncharacterized protein YdaU (DUF1376 family)